MAWAAVAASPPIAAARIARRDCGTDASIPMIESSPGEPVVWLAGGGDRRLASSRRHLVLGRNSRAFEGQMVFLSWVDSWSTYRVTDLVRRSLDDRPTKWPCTCGQRRLP